MPIATVTVRVEPCELIVTDAYHRGTFSDRQDAA